MRNASTRTCSNPSRPSPGPRTRDAATRTSRSRGVGRPVAAPGLGGKGAIGCASKRRPSGQYNPDRPVRAQWPLTQHGLQVLFIAAAPADWGRDQKRRARGGAGSAADRQLARRGSCRTLAAMWSGRLRHWRLGSLCFPCFSRLLEATAS